MSPFLDQRSKWNWKNMLKTFFHNIYFPHWASSGSYFTLRGLMCAMTLIQYLKSKVKVTRDLFRSSSGPFILSYLLNLAKTTCRQWVYSTYTLTQVSMRKDRCHIRLLCKRLVHAVCVSSLFYLPYSTPYNAFMMYDTFRKKKSSKRSRSSKDLLL